MFPEKRNGEMRAASERFLLISGVCSFDDRSWDQVKDLSAHMQDNDDETSFCIIQGYSAFQDTEERIQDNMLVWI